MLHDIVEFLREFGIWGLFIHSFADAVIFPIPAFFTQVSLSILDPSNALWLATIGYIACLIGTPVGYLIGKVLGKSILYKILKPAWIDSATKMFQKSGETAILIGSFTPIPFKVFTIMSGCLKFPLWRLIAYAAVGRAVKFYVVGLLFYLYGQSAAGMVKGVSLYVFLGAIPLFIIFFIVRKYRRNKKARAAESDVTVQDEAKVVPLTKEATEVPEESEQLGKVNER
jgi:membrane protein YqaA with SNARE-associated domain